MSLKPIALSTEYKRQRAWRDWPTVLDALPTVRGRVVLDLGCGVGDQAAELVARGARVIGVDQNEDMLSEARAQALAGADFRRHDLGALPELGVSADGVWCSFVAAYFPDLPATLHTWTRHLVPGGWIALTEIDDLFGHEPLSSWSKSALEAYAREALADKRYDFHMGSKLKTYLLQCDFVISRELTLHDRELSFAGPASVDVLGAWHARFDRMRLLREVIGAGFERLREEFLGCLASPNHHSTAKVYTCIATKRNSPAPG